MTRAYKTVGWMGLARSNARTSIRREQTAMLKYVGGKELAGKPMRLGC
jgi:hypothetical protein